VQEPLFEPHHDPAAPLDNQRSGRGGSGRPAADADAPAVAPRQPVDDDAATASAVPKVEVRRSRRRRRSVTAYRDGDTTVILMPAHIPRADEQQWIDDMLRRLDRQQQRRRPTDDALMKRARHLAREYLPAGAPLPTSVRWVDNQRRRWGSCTPADGTIRLSDRLQGMPTYVIDYVLLHELAHLIEFGHGPRFQALVAAYPHDAKATGYLDGWIDGSGQRDVLSSSPDDEVDPPSEPSSDASDAS
jgi:predicted metal-dependent hydrolase